MNTKSCGSDYTTPFLMLTILLTIEMIASMAQMLGESIIHTGFPNVGFLIIFTGVPWIIFGVTGLLGVILDLVFP